jgi:hypothetical protein
VKFQTTLLIFLFPAFILNVKCKKDKYTPPNVLPPVTQEGKNTFGCKVNGEIWVPYYECPAFRLNCSELNASAGNSLSNGFFRLNIDAGRWFGNTNTRLSIATYPYQTLSSTGDKSDSVEVYFYGDNYKIYSDEYYPGSIKRFEVTNFDTTNKVVSGIFEFTLYKSREDSIRITEGRFDLKFWVCKCSD